MKRIYLIALATTLFAFRTYDSSYYNLSSGSFSQDWSNIAMITANDDWSGVSSVTGYLGQDITTSTGVDPQTLLAASAVANDIDVIANQTSTAISNGGVAEFHIANPSIALQGSGTADAPYVNIYLNSTGRNSVRIQYNLRDIDATTDNAVQPVALQYRIGNSGNYTNVPAGFVADATSGPSLATLVTAVDITLPAACDNQPQLEVRIITANAVGNDEWVAVDDITISSSSTPVKTVSVSSGINASEPSTNGTFTISFSAATTIPTTMEFAYTGTATFSSDYSVAYSSGTPSTATSTGVLTVPAGVSSITVTIAPIDDPTVEGTESITLTLSAPSGGYSLGTGFASINLNDNDVAPTISVASGSNAGEPSTNGTFTINFSAPTVAPTAMNFAYTGTAGFTTDYTVLYSAGSPSTASSTGVLTVPAGTSSVTVTVTPVNDPDVEVSETIILTLSAPTGGYALGTASASINITSDDIPPPTPIVLTGAPYSQNFNTLANSGTANVLDIQGWLLNETGGGARDNELYAADNGGSNTGDTYSYGTTASSDRAFGSLQSGTLISTMGAFFINNTGSTILRIKITYKGEQWRLGAINRSDRLDFQYSLDASSLMVGTWTDFDQLDFSSPFTTTAGALDGNAAANSRQVVFTLTDLNIPNGGLFYIRWNDVNASGSDDGLAIDDFIIETNPVDVSGPVVTALSPLHGAINLQPTFTASISFDENIQKAAGNILVKRVSDNAIVQTINTATSAVTVAGNMASFDVTGLLFSTAYYIEISAGAFKDVLNNNFAGISGNSTWSFTTVGPPPPGIVGNNYNFDICTNPFTNGFTQYSVVGAQKWECTTFGIDALHTPAGSAPNGVQINGFSVTNIPNEDWLISPVFDLTGTTYPLLSFWSRTAFNGLPLQLKVSTDYPGAGNPNNYTWTDLNGRFPAQTSNVWTLSDNINLSSFKTTHTYFAFVYSSSDDDGARWTLDDILVSNSPTPPPPSLTVSTTDIQFPYVASGSTASKTFTFIGNDLTNDVTLNATGSFQLSKDGSGFSSSLLYTVAEANNSVKTVYVRFAPMQNGQEFTGSIQVVTGSLNSTINLKGTSLNPANTLEVVNWNLEWFGSPTMAPNNDNLQEQNVRTILQNIGADIYGVVEVVDEARLASVVSQMPGYSYVIGNYGSHVNPPDPTGGPLAAAQKLAFIYKTSLFSNISTRPLINNQNVNSTSYNNWASGRYPFLMTADVTMNCITKRINFVLIHAKANTSPTATSYARRLASANELHDTLVTYFGSENVIVLGDFNDDLDVSITAGFTTTSYSAFTTDPANFFSPTLALSLAGKKSTVSYSDVIDHVMLSNELVPYYMAGSANILSDVANLVSNYGSTTTDHYPVFTRYRFNNTPPVVSCTEQVTLCATANNTYTIPVFVATDVCNQPAEYAFTISGATTRSGSSNNASGTFNTGTSTIIWTATDSWGNTSTCQTTVTINLNPSVTIPDAYALSSGVLANTVYIGYTPASSITLVANASGGTGGFSYSWTNGSTLSSTTVSPVVNTLYTVTVTDGNNCQANASKNITVMDIRGGKNLNKTIICHRSTNTITIDPSDVINHLAHGDILGGCTTPLSRPVTLAGSADNYQHKLSLDALPNPAGGLFRLAIGGDELRGSINLIVTDVTGRVIENIQNLRAGHTLVIGQSYRAGIYFAQISQGSERVMLKLVRLN
jgi:hypothetical protein